METAIRSPKLVDFTESLRVTTQTAATFWGGVAESVAQAFGAFRDALEPEKARLAGLSGSILEGVLAGNASFFRRMAQTSESILEETKSANLAPTPAQPIDYDLLARMVAERLQGRKANE
jgi:hypothetical protein